MVSVPFDEQNRGDPFRGEFPGWPDHEPLDELESGMQRQAIELTQQRHDSVIRTSVRLLTVAAGRGRRQTEDGAGSPRAGIVTQFDFLPVQVGFDALLVRGELLITAQSYDGRPRRRTDWT